MARKHASKQEEANIDMTPMLDVVFIMLIFFIVTAVFVKEAGIAVAKPEAEMSMAQQQASILIAINEDNEITWPPGLEAYDEMVAYRAMVEWNPNDDGRDDVW